MLYAMAIYFREHDYDATLRSEAGVGLLLQQTQQGYARFRQTMSRADAHPPGRNRRPAPALPLANRAHHPLPEVAVMHTVAAGLCSLPGILARQRFKCLFSAHGTWHLLARAAAGVGTFGYAL